MDKKCTNVKEDEEYVGRFYFRFFFLSHCLFLFNRKVFVVIRNNTTIGFLMYTDHSDPLSK